MAVLFIPSVEKGNGTGHLKRCIKQVIESAGDFYIYLPDDFTEKNRNNIAVQKIIKPLFEQNRVVSVLDRKFDIIVSDKRETSEKEFETYMNMSSLLVGIDEGGCMREYFPYLIDILPSLSDHSPNIFSTGLLGIKSRDESEGKNSSMLKSGIVSEKEGKASVGNTGEIKGDSFSRPDKIRKILVTFGGEDPAGLTDNVLDILTSEYFITDTEDYENVLKSPEGREKKSDTGISVKNHGRVSRSSGKKVGEIKAVRGPLFRKIITERGGVEIIDSPESLNSLIDDADLVITSFGLTAYEALYAGKYVVLVNPSEYHSRLSAKGGFPEAGLGSADRKKLIKYIDNPYSILSHTTAVREKSISLGSLIKGLEKSGIERCPFCGTENIPLKRFRDRNYHICRSCSLVYMEKFSPDRIDYSRDYFFDDYKKQYGKTYIEDFDNIKKMSDIRVETIGKYIEKGKILDIGCAYGPFLKAASEEGFIPYGMDVSEEAIEYVRNRLSIDAEVCDFSTFDNYSDYSFDAVTMWYVIEHFRNPEAIVDKVKKILKTGGVFAFSTPNFNGVSGKTDMAKTLLNSPDDHYTFWSIESASGILTDNGFEILEVRNTGHHPERFSSKIKKIIPLTLLKHMSFLLRLGDTFEIYARKK